MKAKLEFDLPEERFEFLQAVKGQDALLALWDYQQKLRTVEKYQWESIEDNKDAMYEKLKDDFFEILDDHGLNLDDLIM